LLSFIAKTSSNGQITIPIEIRRKLKLKSGDKILFIERDNGEIVLSNASLSALFQAQDAFQNVAESTELKDEYQVQAEIDRIRYGKD
jgi:antitoxin PrlF